MKKILHLMKTKHAIWGIGIVVMMLFAVGFGGSSAFAANCGGAETNIVECGADEGGTWHIISLVLDIFSLGVAILGVIAIIAVGVQYMTAGPNVAQAQKAKTRISEIIIGLAVYAVLFSLLEWLLPGGIIGSESEFAKMGSTNQVEEIRRIQEEAMANDDELRGYTFDEDLEGGGSGSSGSGSVDGMSNEEVANELARVAKEFAKDNEKYRQAVKDTGAGTESDACKRVGKSCGVYVSTVVRTVFGNKSFPTTSDSIDKYVKKHPKQWKIIEDDKEDPQPGDILYEYGGGKFTNHSGMFVEKNGKATIAEASYPENVDSSCTGGISPHITSYHKGATPKSNRYGRPNSKYFRYIGN